MKILSLFALVSLSAASALATPPAATVPASVNVQGVLRDGVGGLESGSFQFTINVYAAATGGTTLWTETQKAIPVESGFFTLTLTSNDGNTQTIAQVIEGNASPLFVGVTLQGDATELPRIQLNTVPYAFVADHATSVDNFGSVPANSITKLFSNSCGAGTFATGLNADGTFICGTPAGTTYSGDGANITVNSSTHMISPSGNLATVAALSASSLTTAAADASSLDVIAMDTANLHTLAGEEASLNALAQTQSCANGLVAGLTSAGALTCDVADGNATIVINGTTNTVGLAGTIAQAETFSKAVTVTGTGSSLTVASGSPLTVGGVASFASTSSVTNSGATTNASGSTHTYQSGSTTTFQSGSNLSLLGTVTGGTATGTQVTVDLHTNTGVKLPITTQTQVGAALSAAGSSLATASCGATGTVIGGSCSITGATPTFQSLLSCPVSATTSTQTAGTCLTSGSGNAWTCTARWTSGSGAVTATAICLTGF